MDAELARAMARWPDVPACHGWLSLDLQGHWRLQDVRVTHPGMIDFFARNYGHDDAGRWFVQNGPQRVFVRLAYTPWILRTAAASASSPLTTHTGIPFADPDAAWLDESGYVLISGADGIGLLHGHDLVPLADGLEPPHEGSPGALTLAGLRLALNPIRRQDIAGRFGFIADPQPD